MLAKQLEYLGGAQLAGIVLGARVPTILTAVLTRPRHDWSAAPWPCCCTMPPTR